MEYVDMKQSADSAGGRNYRNDGAAVVLWLVGGVLTVEWWACCNRRTVGR